MAQSQNSSVEYSVSATSFMGLATYGNLLLGNKALEFYNEKNPEDFIQIPWDEIDHVAASVLFGGRSISRFAVFTRGSGTYSFSTRDNKATLRAMRAHVPDEHLVRSPDLLEVLCAGVRGIPGAVATLLHRGNKQA